MPTEYTAPLHDGEDITFEQFALRPWNCTGWAIDEDDNMTDCETPNHNEQGQSNG